mmetsp:Transcript_59820/g.160316  ORF Transcript_59820/g.160316 Transcript_59820/m.160316 type:complete len:232 (-) Transcript_59820:93-788(-)
MGHEVLRGGALHHDVCDTSLMVRDLRAAGLPRGVLRLQEGAHLSARADEPDPAPSSSAAVVHQRGLLLARGGDPALRRGLHGALLHHVLDLAAPVLLPLRLPHARDRHTSGHLRGDIHHPDVLPADQRGLQLVVAILLRERLLRRVRLHVLVPLLLHAHADRPLRRRPALLWLHVCDVVHVRPPHRLHRLLLHLPVCPSDLRFNQDRLMRGGCSTARSGQLGSGASGCPEV